MKFSLWTNHGALNSKPVFTAFADSVVASGHDVVWNDPVSDVDVIWSVLWSGRMAKNKSIWQRNMEQSKPTVVLEVGGIRRGTTWKVGINGINREAYFGESGNDSTRATKLGLSLRPWDLGGRDIILCGQHDRSHQWRDMPPMSKWILDTIKTIRAQTARPIIFRPHPRCRLPGIEHEFINVKRQEPIKVPNSYDDFDFNLHNTYAVVSWTSNPGIHAVLNGVPAVVGPASLAYDVAEHSVENINNPNTPDRTQWLNDYAYTEWTVDEISSGQPLARLTPKLEELLIDKSV